MQGDREAVGPEHDPDPTASRDLFDQQRVGAGFPAVTHCA